MGVLNSMFRIGFGYDAHRLVEGERLILGGVEIDHPWGLEGHSDADILVHAVMDAILGAMGLGDIGLHFPDTDPAYKGASSLSLLEKVSERMKENGFRVNNIDATIVAEGPKLSPFFGSMGDNIARALESSPDRVNIKATTTEGMGPSGRGEGMEAYAVASLVQGS
ncbi:MAG: 2-C-methyl-D-erythritol 2,4-cyclodiphosphate synthase [Desulfatiglandaceae bacterium]|jgi:2-C-methyl-D-erythritol 2,4-cyclodiphosphate synthase